MVDDKIYLETMIKLDGHNLIVHHSDGTVTAPSGNGGADTDVTPYQHDFRADDLSGASADEPVEAMSEADDEPAPWETLSALQKGHSF